MTLQNAHMTFYSSDGFTAEVAESGYDTIDLSIQVAGVHCRFFLAPSQAASLAEKIGAVLKPVAASPVCEMGLLECHVCGEQATAHGPYTAEDGLCESCTKGPEEKKIS